MPNWCSDSELNDVPTRRDIEDMEREHQERAERYAKERKERNNKLNYNPTWNEVQDYMQDTGDR